MFATRTGLRRLGGRRRGKAGRVVGLPVAAVVVTVVLVAVVLGAVVLGAGAPRGVQGGGDSGTAPSSSTVGAGQPGAPSGRESGSAAADVPAAAGPAAAPAVAPEVDPGAVPVGGVARSLVRTAQLSVQAGDPVAVTRRVRTAVAGLSGTVAQETSSDTGAQLTLRVPADRLDQLIDTIGGFGYVTDRSAQVVDATEDVVDLDARVTSQRASVDRVRALLAQAHSIGDIVSVESELTRREADLDSLTGRLAALKDQVALSTLSVDLEKSPVTAGPDPAPTGFLGGLTAGWDGLKVITVAAGAVLGYVLPFAPVVALLLATVWLGRRVARTRRTSPAAGGPEGPGV